MNALSPKDRRLPRRRDDVLVADFGTELVVLVPDQRQAHRLDEGLSLVLTSCDGTTFVDALVAEVSEGTGEDPAVTARWLDGCLDRLEALGVFGGDDEAAPEHS